MSNIASIAFWQRERTAVRDSLENQVKSLAISRRAMTESFPQRNFPEAMLNLVEQSFQQVLATIAPYRKPSTALEKDSEFISWASNIRAVLMAHKDWARTAKQPDPPQLSSYLSDFSDIVSRANSTTTPPASSSRKGKKRKSAAMVVDISDTDGDDVEDTPRLRPPRRLTKITRYVFFDFTLEPEAPKSAAEPSKRASVISALSFKRTKTEQKQLAEVQANSIQKLPFFPDHAIVQSGDLIALQSEWFGQILDRAKTVLSEYDVLRVGPEAARAISDSLRREMLIRAHEVGTLLTYIDLLRKEWDRMQEVLSTQPSASSPASVAPATTTPATS
ncbi:hypothetical protein CC2G_015083 [Coprinopsis cinerea AmutBmut pab1-1]|nr:hypothetical protein CC2G_015083 [Coprinopsis cinerea AmutBmut pab1-1]